MDQRNDAIQTVEQSTQRDHWMVAAWSIDPNGKIDLRTVCEDFPEGRVLVA